MRASTVLQHIPEPQTCGCKAAWTGCVTWSPVPHPRLCALLRPCSTAAICTCGWQWRGKSHPLSARPLIHPTDEQIVLGGLLLPASDCERAATVLIGPVTA